MRNYCIFCGNRLVNDACVCSEYQAYFGVSAPVVNKHFCSACGKELFGDQTCDCQTKVAPAPAPTPAPAVEPAPRMVSTMKTGSGSSEPVSIPTSPSAPASTSERFQQAGDL